MSVCVVMLQCRFCHCCCILLLLLCCCWWWWICCCCYSAIYYCYCCCSGQYKPCSNSVVKTPSCSKSCRSSYQVDYSHDKHFGDTFYWVHGASNIMKEIYTNGPVEASFMVYQDFLSYKSGQSLFL